MIGHTTCAFSNEALLDLLPCIGWKKNTLYHNLRANIIFLFKIHSNFVFENYILEKYGILFNCIAADKEKFPQPSACWIWAQSLKWLELGHLP